MNDTFYFVLVCCVFALIAGTLLF